MRRRVPRVRPGVPAAWAVALVAAAFGPVLLRRATLLPLLPVQVAAPSGPRFLLDAIVPAWFTYPLAAVIHRGWRTDGPPLWSSLSGCGEPLAAEAEPGVFAPLRAWQALGPPTPLRFDGWALGRLVLAGWLAWGWAEAVGLGILGCLTASGAWMLSGFWVGNVALDSMDGEVWLPLLGALLLRGLARPGRAVWLGGALAGAALLLDGNPQAALVDGAFLAALLGCVVRRRGARPGAVGGAGLAAGWALAASAPAWLPLAEFLPRAQHVHAGAGAMANPWWTAATLVVPRAFGPFGEALGPLTGGNFMPWAGLMTVALAVAGIRTTWRAPAGPAIVLAPAVLLAFVYGIPPAGWLGRLPVLSMVWWAKYQAPTYLALATLAGFGADAVATRAGRRAGWLVAAAAVGELLWHVPRARPAPHDPLVPADYVRYLQRAMDPREDRLWAPGFILEPHASDALGLADARTYYGLYPRRAYWYVRGLVTGPAATPSAALFTGSPRLEPALHAPALRALAVRWLVTPPATPPGLVPREWAPAYRGAMTVWRRGTALARARVVGRAVRVPDARAALLATSGDPASTATAFVEGPADWIGFAALARAGPARVTEDRGGALRVEIRPAPAPRVLLLADTWEPGWKAFAAGVRLRVLPADCMFRAVAVPPGAAAVDFRFDPLPVKLGVLAAALALGLALGLVPATLRGG